MSQEDVQTVIDQLMEANYAKIEERILAATLNASIYGTAFTIQSQNYDFGTEFIPPKDWLLPQIVEAHKLPSVRLVTPKQRERIRRKRAINKANKRRN